jgi:hypothetical protein
MSVPRSAPGSGTTSAALVERERELETFDELLGQAAGRASDDVVIEEAAGIGKSHLLDALRDRAAATGMRVRDCSRSEALSPVRARGVSGSGVPLGTAGGRRGPGGARRDYPACSTTSP